MLSYSKDIFINFSFELYNTWLINQQWEKTGWKLLVGN